MSRAQLNVAVVGAGVFGAWTALHLLARGASVTLLDAWGAANPRATSASETRVLRCGYGQKLTYSAWTWHALELWQHFERETRHELFVPAGVLWLCSEEDEYTCASLAALERFRVPHERLAVEEIAHRFPQFSLDGISFGYFEPQSGFLRARVATLALADAVRRRGGRVMQAAAQPPAAKGGPAAALDLSDGTTLSADAFVFACGPWLPELFPDLLSRRIRPTRQEEFFFRTPDDPRYRSPALPVWVEPAAEFYAIPSDGDGGVKVAEDRNGPTFDPTGGDRTASAEGQAIALEYLAHRLPALAQAAVIHSRVCQYERTPDSHLVIDRHPQLENVWLVGGGSGHGFKLGPAVGEIVARLVCGDAGVADTILPPMRLGASAFGEDVAVVSASSL